MASQGQPLGLGVEQDFLAFRGGLEVQHILVEQRVVEQLRRGAQCGSAAASHTCCRRWPDRLISASAAAGSFISACSTRARRARSSAESKRRLRAATIRSIVSARKIVMPTRVEPVGSRELF